MKLKPFLDQLPIPKVLQPKERHQCYNYYEVTMREFFHQMHSQLPPTKVWGYEGQLPGPILDVNKDEGIKVKWMNDLPEKHFLPIDYTLHSSGKNMPEVRTVVHLHGMEVEPESDGYPDAWFTRGFAQIGPRFERDVYYYPNHQRAATLWYHDHAIGITRLNVYAGLAGMYIIRDEEEKSLGLPSGKYEIPLIIQDKSFNCDGSLLYPSQPNNPPPNAPFPSITPGFAGDVILVNGKAWPFLEVEPKKYRFRILNASNERFYTLRLDHYLPFIQIGSDGGLLSKPAEMKTLTLGPAERADIILDFSQFPVNKKITLLNEASNPFNFGAPPDPETTGLVMQFKVIPASEPDTSVVPAFLISIKKIKECEAKRTRDITLDVSFDGYGRLMFMLNNHSFMDRITETPRLGDVEIWQIINAGLAVHPIHVHLVQFQILDRIPFDVAAYNTSRQITFTGEPKPPAPNERGWKDTVQAYDGYITRIIMRFAPYTGRYVYHCHILEHEDYDMMRPFLVQKPECKCQKYCQGGFCKAGCCLCE